MNRFEAVARLLRQNFGEHVGSGAAEARIEACEAALGCPLPESYRWFLSEFGYALSPEHIYGISPGNSIGVSVVANAECERHEAEPVMPPHLVPVSPDGWGNHYCLG